MPATSIPTATKTAIVVDDGEATTTGETRGSVHPSSRSDLTAVTSETLTLIQTEAASSMVTPKAGTKSAVSVRRGIKVGSSSTTVYVTDTSVDVSVFPASPLDRRRTTSTGIPTTRSYVLRRKEVSAGEEVVSIRDRSTGIRELTVKGLTSSANVLEVGKPVVSAVTTIVPLLTSATEDP